MQRTAGAARAETPAAGALNACAKRMRTLFPAYRMKIADAGARAEAVRA
jgi:hypothetical protein